MPARFDLQGHRGARGLRPENTLPSFEAALDAGVTTIETDVHLTGDRVPVLFHDSAVSERTCRRLGGGYPPSPSARPLVSSLTLAQLQKYAADINPAPLRFADQEPDVTPLADRLARSLGIHPYAPPQVADLLTFAGVYAGDEGAKAGKGDDQRRRAARLRFDFELKRVPYRPDWVGDGFDGDAAGLLEEAVVRAVEGVIERTAIRSFDHRSVRAVRRIEPRLTTAVLVAGTAPVEPAELVRRAEAQVYCPDFEFLDERQVRQCRAEGIRVIPWTVNDPEDWRRLLDWGVDGMTTDYPDRLAAWLRERGVEF